MKDLALAFEYKYHLALMFDYKHAEVWLLEKIHSVEAAAVIADRIARSGAA